MVCEGAKTEPNYFNEIRQLKRLSSATVKVIQSQLGTQPLKIVDSAVAVFEASREFDKVFVVFDRDDHPDFQNAVRKAEALRNKMKNDEKKPVPFEAIVSIPSFEIWLLLHFVDIQAWLHRDEALRRLKAFIRNYEKGSKNIFASTEPTLGVASSRGSRLKSQNSRLAEDVPYTDVQDLVVILLNLR